MAEEDDIFEASLLVDEAEDIFERADAIEAVEVNYVRLPVFQKPL